MTGVPDMPVGGGNGSPLHAFEFFTNLPVDFEESCVFALVPAVHRLLLLELPPSRGQNASSGQIASRCRTHSPVRWRRLPIHPGDRCWRGGRQRIVRARRSRQRTAHLEGAHKRRRYHPIQYGRRGGRLVWRGHGCHLRHRGQNAQVHRQGYGQHGPALAANHGLRRTLEKGQGARPDARVCRGGSLVRACARHRIGTPVCVGRALHTQQLPRASDNVHARARLRRTGDAELAGRKRGDSRGHRRRHERRRRMVADRAGRCEWSAPGALERS